MATIILIFLPFFNVFNVTIYEITMHESLSNCLKLLTPCPKANSKAQRGVQSST